MHHFSLESKNSSFSIKISKTSTATTRFKTYDLAAYDTGILRLNMKLQLVTENILILDGFEIKYVLKTFQNISRMKDATQGRLDQRDLFDFLWSAQQSSWPSLLT